MKQERAGMIQQMIAKLVEGAHPTGDEAYATLREVMMGEATSAQIAAFITALRIRGETAEVIAGATRAMREQFTRVATPVELVVDTCGTGGDGAQTFNISTAAALVAAGAGVVVAKHGNRRVSSQCGSADVLSELGVNIAIDAERMAQCLEQVGIAFLFAPALHPAMKHAIGPRREIGIRTIFNILGPLSNPAGAQHGVLGVYHRDLVAVMANALNALNAQRMFVVHGEDGLDEITTTGRTFVGEIHQGEVSLYELDPESLGLARAQPEALRGGTPAENAALLREILAGAAGPKRDIVVINAAAAILAAERASDWPAAIALAQEAIDSGAAAGKLEDLIACTNAE
jgi:anthranilate phosphoribosyltransferase